MTHFLGWSTNWVSDEEWAMMAEMLKQGDFYYERGDTAPSPVRQLVQVGLFREHDVPRGTMYDFSINGELFARELLPERYR